MRLLLRIFLAALLVAPAPASATAGTRVTYARERGPPLKMEIADNGDVRAEFGSGLQVVVSAGVAYLVQERLTGPLVTKVADLAAAQPSAGADVGSLVEEAVTISAGPASLLGPEAIAAASLPVEDGRVTVNGREGRAYRLSGWGVFDAGPPLVVSDDPSLARLAPATLQVLRALGAVEQSQLGAPPLFAKLSELLLAAAGERMPLRFNGLSLRSIERQDFAEESFALPGPVEEAAALAARLAEESAEREPGATPRPTIERAAFAGGRLWLLEGGGTLTSLAEGEKTRIPADLRDPVLDICALNGVLIAVTGRRDQGAEWVVRRWDGTAWSAVPLPRRRDALVTLSCSGAGPLVLTSRRLIDLSVPRPQIVQLSETLTPAEVTAVVYSTPASVFVGLNAGEWGGGLRHVDRRTGRVTVRERNATGELCGGPLNTQCDPVHGIAAIPWKPECVAAAVGLIHMLAHGRVVSVCPGGSIEQIFAAPDADAFDPADAKDSAEASVGGYGSVAFFGLAVKGEHLLAVGHDGLYRIGADGRAAHQRWPRFVEIDGVLVSFAVPEAILVMTELNRRASMSGLAPLLVPH